ncbi:ferredoxin--NADP(+) reductase [Candidatus Curculioniphilus buchneri]|uniref:ferredoxin--NADP(+) reductase n=1 Tax=Candidatus Curculioniphilus buchneri TaxID=690594 RepID=UPI00376EF76A
MVEWVTGNVVQIKYWTDRLFSLVIHAPINTFSAGQFAKLKLDINNKNIQRAYSYVNAPYNENLEFYIISVLEGKLSPRLHALKPGNSLMITKDSSGSFILKAIPSCKELWMLATGTALGPYLSILDQRDDLDRFERIILVHATRFVQDLNYLTKMLELQRSYNGKLRIQTIVSREQAPGSITGRIPDLITNGALEKAVDTKLDARSSHVMLCGNPKMIHDVQQLLNINYDMHKNFKHRPGHVTSEHYW